MRDRNEDNNDGERDSDGNDSEGDTGRYSNRRVMWHIGLRLCPIRRRFACNLNRIK